MIPSPVVVKRYWFARVKLNAGDRPNPGETLDLAVETLVWATPLTARGFLVTLSTTVRPRGDGIEPIAELEAVGEFEALPALTTPALALSVTRIGAGVLYAATREFLKQTTSPSPRGALILPAVSFGDLRQAPDDTGESAPQAGDSA